MDDWPATGWWRRRLAYFKPTDRVMSLADPSHLRKVDGAQHVAVHRSEEGQRTLSDIWMRQPVGTAGLTLEYAELDDITSIEEEEEEEFFSHYKNDLNGHAHTPSGVAGADLKS